MKKFPLVVIVTGGLILVGFALFAYGSQLITENVSINEGSLSPGETIEIQMTLDPKSNEKGRYVVKIADFDEDIVTITVLDPFEISIVSESVNQESFEEGFKIASSGTYSLLVENPGDKDLFIVGAIGYLPSDAVLAVSRLGLIITVVGLGGIIIGGIYLVRTRRKQ